MSQPDAQPVKEIGFLRTLWAFAWRVGLIYIGAQLLR